MRKLRSRPGNEADTISKTRWGVRCLALAGTARQRCESAAAFFRCALTLSLFAVFASAAEPLETPFHMGSAKEKPALTDRNRKRMEACTADFQAVLRGKKPIDAKLDPAEESTETDQFYEGPGYQVHVTKSPVVIDGVSGFIYGPIIELDEGFAEGEMLSMFHTAFYTAEEMKRADPADTPFHVGTGKDKPAWNEKAEKRIVESMADYQALIAGKKPSHAKPEGAHERVYQGEGYQIDIIKEPVVIAGVAGFFYGPMLDLDRDPSHPADIDSISHVAFYAADELEKLLGKK
jgi:hypothetical protein